MRRRARQRQDGAAARAPQERRHRRDHHADRAQAEPRLAQLRRHLARPLQDQAPDPARGAGARHRPRPEGVREGSCAATTCSVKALQDAEAFAKALADVGAQDARRSVRADRLRHAVGQAAARASSCPAERLREKAPEGAVAAAVKRVFGGGEEKIKVRGSDDLLVFRARCCNPIRGEKIVGYITRGKGVSVHSATCPNVVNLLYDPERRIEVEWDKARRATARNYTVKLTMEVEDRKGLLAAVSAKIADINTNIKNMEARTDDDDQRARIDVTVEISDLKHLEKVIKSLRGVERRARRRAGRRAAESDSRTRRRRLRLQLTLRSWRSRRSRSARRAAAARPGRSTAPDRARLKNGRVDLVHRREVVHVGEEHRRADDVGEGEAAGVEQRADVLERRGASGRAMSPVDQLRRSRDRAAPGRRRTAAGRRGAPASRARSAFGASGLETATSRRFTRP